MARHTSAWIRGRLLKTEQGEDLYDSYTVEVLDTTDPHTPATIHVSARDSCGDIGVVGEEYYMALCGDGIKFSLLEGVRNAMYSVPKVAAEGQELDRELDWEVMCDTRLLVDRDGDILGEIREKWLGRLYRGTPEEAYYALGWLEQLREPNIDPVALAASVSRHFHQLQPPGRNDPYSHCLLLYQKAAATVARLGHVQAAKTLADVYWEDQDALQILRANSTDHLVVRLLLVPPSEDNVNFLATLLGNRLETSAGLIDTIAEIPGEPVRQLLWHLIEEPGVYGLSNTWTLEAVWRGLAARNDLELRPYLEAEILEPEVPELGFPIKEKIDDLKVDAAKYCRPIVQPEKSQSGFPEDDPAHLRELREALDATDRSMRETAFWEAERTLGLEFGYIEDQPRALNDAALAACKKALHERIESPGNR